jgi:hypothetical protein
LQTGYYTVVVSDPNGCKNSFTVYVLISGINEVMTGANISIYPNPVTDDLMVEFSYANLVSNETGNGWLNGLGRDEITLSIVNTLGQKIFSVEEKISFADWKKQIDVSSIAPGIYFLEINSNHFSVVRKIVIER